MTFEMFFVVNLKKCFTLCCFYLYSTVPLFRRCVSNTRALLESGTLGAKGHVQVRGGWSFCRIYPSLVLFSSTLVYSPSLSPLPQSHLIIVNLHCAIMNAMGRWGCCFVLSRTVFFGAKNKIRFLPAVYMQAVCECV